MLVPCGLLLKFYVESTLSEFYGIFDHLNFIGLGEGGDHEQCLSENSEED